MENLAKKPRLRMLSTLWRTFALGCILVSIQAAGDSQSDIPERSGAREDGSVNIPAFNLPFSSIASTEAKASLLKSQHPNVAVVEAAKRDIAAYRKVLDEQVFLPLVARQKARYQVDVRQETIGGVYTEVFTAKSGEAHRDRVLINLHGGGFLFGARTVGQIESIPVAHIARVKVISIDYRMGPEHRFPAASEDVASVYKELLKRYEPHNIGVYGCSAGGLLAAQLVAWLQKEKLPIPGAIGVFCSAIRLITPEGGGDSALLTFRLTGSPEGTLPKTVPYFEGIDLNDPLVTPSVSPAVLSRFPATLLITGSRSFEMSGALKSQIDLTLAGVDARLYAWDGMMHGFLMDPELPESREAYQIIAGFFSEYLGRRHERRASEGS